MLARLLCGFANQVAARYNAPVYLVGSALTNAASRDVDLVVILTDDQWEKRYEIGYYDHLKVGDYTGLLVNNYWLDVAKLNQWALDKLKLNVDFKVQNESQVKQYNLNGPRLRLDKLDL